MVYITPVQRIYFEVSQPASQPPKRPTVATEANPIELTSADVDAIIQRKRYGSPEELQRIIGQSKDLGLTDAERTFIGVELSLAVAQRTRQVNGRANPSAEFISKVLGLAETPYGLISREWVNQQMRTGSQAIARCRNHRPPDCACWADSRAILWQASASGAKTPEAWAAARVYDLLADLELASSARRVFRGDQSLRSPGSRVPSRRFTNPGSGSMSIIELPD
jgi:hypothetical protein